MVWGERARAKVQRTGARHGRLLRLSRCTCRSAAAAHNPYAMLAAAFHKSTEIGLIHPHDRNGKVGCAPLGGKCTGGSIAAASAAYES